MIRVQKTLEARQHSRQPLGPPGLADDLGAEQQQHQIFNGTTHRSRVTEGRINLRNTLHHLRRECTVVFLHFAIVMFRSMGMVVNGLQGLPRLPVEGGIG